MATLRSDLGDVPWETRTTARERIFGADPVYVRQLLEDAALADLNEWGAAFVADMRGWLARGQRITPKQVRTLEDLIARSR